ncbi:hypothetical protein HYH03_008816 [Edaphochlamys debaryana]|uniref:Ion transport domain-containing protein n=1 Tax=Edaphochlamys debaryana TaxID=47281 RepID=A0A835XXG8_9CHLO|nr:hypothetical protein HYH03_008816 [Edaphochlamys debaryana]|eukprot:KAG2492902.1 hypothetical protein HYH03_008816 [Edaphochlamys debaryana]
MTGFNKVAPSGPQGDPGGRGIKFKFFNRSTNDGFAESQAAAEQAPRGGASLLTAPSSEYLEEIAEIQQLSEAEDYLSMREEDPGFTLLHYVSMLGHTTLAGAINSATQENMAHYARIARYLVRRGHEVYVVDKYGCIPLQIAAAYGNTELVNVLLEPFDAVVGRKETKKRSDYLNHQDTQIRFTALHGALNHGQHEVAVLLLEQAANPQILDITRSNAFQVAPSLEALQELLRLVVQHEDVVPTPAIAQLMIEVIKQQEAREKKEKAERAKAQAAADAARGKEDEESKAKAEWAKALSTSNMDYTQRMLFVAINQLVHKASSGPGEGADAAEREAAARAAAEAGGEVGAIIKRLFKELYAKGEGKHNELWEYVQAAVDYNNYKLTKIMLDLITSDCPRALASCNWEATMGPLIACFPDLFHVLLAKLQDMSDADVIGFVQSLRPTSLHSVSSNATGNAYTSFASMAYLSSGPSGVKSSPSTARGAKGAAHQGKILIYQQLVEGLKQVNYVVVKAFFEKADQQVLNDMAQYPIFKDFVCLISNKRTAEGFTESDSGRSRLLDLLRDVKRVSYEGGPTMTGRPGDLLNRHRALSQKFKLSNRSLFGPGGTSGKDKEELEDAEGEGGTGPHGGGRLVEKQSELAVQTLNVERVLCAAVAARKSMNVEATVKAITSWVNINSKDRKTVFITGISTELLKDLARRFPSGCARLLNLVSRDVLEQLATLQVSASLLHRKDQIVKCSDVRNHFTWRAPELQHLSDEKGFTEHVVDALADYGIPFECTYKAAVEWDATKEHFATLIENHFTGAELKELISNGIVLNRVTDMISRCAHPPEDVPPGSFKAEPMTLLLKEMMREKLSFRIVEAILDAGSMNEATVYTNFRPGNPLYNTYPLALYKPVYTHHFVQALLSNWRKGTKDPSGNWTMRPWDKKFIDTIFAPNDPLCTALKSAYDNKLKDTQVYIENTQLADGWAKKKRQNQHLVLRAFVCRPVLLHRWPVFVLMHMLLYLKDFLKAFWRLMGWEWDMWGGEHHGHSVDARALVIPWKGFADMGSIRGMLTGLIDVDVPVRWFGFAAVKAAITVQWQEFGQILMLMSALAHIIYMCLFGGFLLVVRNAGEAEGGDMSAVRRRPEVMALLVVLGLMSVGGLLEECAQMMELTWRTWRNYLGNIVDITSFALFVVLFGMVWASYDYTSILAVGAVETLVLFVRLVFFASMTDSMGSLMRMVIEIIKDMRYFFLLLGMIFGGFAIAFAVLLGVDNLYESVAFKLFSVMLGDWQYDYLVDMLHVEGMWYVPNLSVLMMSVYGILMLIVLVNLLIAIMNDTYDRIKETEEIEVLHNRARLIVDLESLLTRETREKLQTRLLGDYLHVLVPADNKFNKFMASSESTEGEWKGRMRAFSEAIKRDVDPHLKEIKEKVNTEFKAIHTELDFVRKWIKDQQRVMGHVDEDHDRVTRFR